MSTALATTPDVPAPVRRSSRTRPDVDIGIPVHNERAALEASVRMLHGYLSAPFRSPGRSRSWTTGAPTAPSRSRVA